MMFADLQVSQRSNATLHAKRGAAQRSLHLVRSQDTLINAALIICEAPVGWEAAGNIATTERNNRAQHLGTAARLRGLSVNVSNLPCW